MYVLRLQFCFFFFNDTATTEIYTLSLHDALPIFGQHVTSGIRPSSSGPTCRYENKGTRRWKATKSTASASGAWCSRAVDRKSTRLNSSHANISYAVFCLKKKKKKQNNYILRQIKT